MDCTTGLRRKGGGRNELANNEKKMKWSREQFGINLPQRVPKKKKDLSAKENNFKENNSLQSEGGKGSARGEVALRKFPTRTGRGPGRGRNHIS